MNKTLKTTLSELLVSFIQEKLNLKKLSSRSQLNELSITDHAEQRLNERGNVRDIALTREMVGEYSIDEVKPKLINRIKEELQIKFNALERLNAARSQVVDMLFVIFEPRLSNKGVLQPPLNMRSESSKKDGSIVNDKGYYFFCVVRNNAIITLILSDVPPTEARTRLIAHNKRERIDRDVVALQSANYQITIDLDELMTGQRYVPPKTGIDRRTLQYIPKKDYRKGSKFRHTEHGDGTVIGTSAGSSGKGDSRGKLDWVDVNFGVNGTKRLKNILVNNSPLMAPVNQEN